jgi:hypothetical protein
MYGRTAFAKFFHLHFVVYYMAKLVIGIGWFLVYGKNFPFNFFLMQVYNA